MLQHQSIWTAEEPARQDLPLPYLPLIVDETSTVSYNSVLPLRLCKANLILELVGVVVFPPAYAGHKRK